jgi:hypothetical protein
MNYGVGTSRASAPPIVNRNWHCRSWYLPSLMISKDGTVGTVATFGWGEA